MNNERVSKTLGRIKRMGNGANEYFGTTAYTDKCNKSGWSNNKSHLKSNLPRVWLFEIVFCTGISFTPLNTKGVQSSTKRFFLGCVIPSSGWGIIHTTWERTFCRALYSNKLCCQFFSNLTTYMPSVSPSVVSKDYCVNFAIFISNVLC